MTIDNNSQSQQALMEKRKAYLASLNLSSGIRFCPTEKELVGQFDDEDPIKEFDAYSVEPWDLWKRFSEDEAVDLYFYTKLKRKSSKKNIERGVAGGKGRWHGETGGSEIKIRYSRTEKKKQQQQQVLNFEIRRFSYRNTGHAEDRRWIMIEYKEKSPTVDWAIFHLRKNPEKARDQNGGVPCFGTPNTAESCSSSPSPTTVY